MKAVRQEGRFDFDGVRYRYLSWRPASPAMFGAACALGDCGTLHDSNCEPRTPCGVPMVLLHGFAQQAESWEQAAAALAADRTVYAIDLVGHGASDAPAASPAYGLEAQGAMLLAFLEQVAADGAAPVVVGYSMGGRVALSAACADPDAFSAHAGGLVLESAGFGPATEDERAAAAARDADSAARLREYGIKPFMDAWEQLPLFASQQRLSSEERACVRSGRLCNDPRALACVFEQAGQHVMPDRCKTLRSLRRLADHAVPILYLAGALDAKYCALAEDLGDCACVRVIEDAGHNVHLERPEAFASALADFLERS